MSYWHALLLMITFLGSISGILTILLAHLVRLERND